MGEGVLELDVQLAIEPDGHRVPANVDLEHWVKAVLGADRAAQMTLRIVGSEEMTLLNETYRHGQGVTNVLSFPFAHPDYVDPPLLGDVVICPDRLVAEAQAQDKPVANHWAHLVIHGVLHLLGYDHIENGDAEVMECKEVTLLAQLGIPDPYSSGQEVSHEALDRPGIIGQHHQVRV